MRKVIYWKLDHKDDPVFDLRAKTKKELMSMVPRVDEDLYELPPRKVAIQYNSIVDLLNCVLGEGGEEYANMRAEDGND